MALLKKQLSVKDSTIAGAGKGLFTTAFIAKGSYIVEYKGKKTTWERVKDDHGNGYIYYVDDDRVIDARPHQNALARYANDATGLERKKGFRNNARYVVDNGKVYVEATRNIPAGAEIFVSYGKAYWDRVRKNMRLDEEEKRRA